MPEDARAREIVQKFLRDGLRRRYTAEQTTILNRERLQESQQTLKAGGPGRMRLEYHTPQALRGEIMLVNGGRLFHYKPRLRRIVIGPAPAEEMSLRAGELFAQIRSGRMTVRYTGDEEIAGQSAAVITIGPRNGTVRKRMWIDKATGVRLKIEDFNPQGQPISTSFLTRIDYASAPDDRDFLPLALPPVPRVAFIPATPPLSTIAEAAAASGGTVKEPSLPSGYRLDGIWVMRGRADRKTTVIRLTDGETSMVLYQTPIPSAPEPMGGPLALLDREPRFMPDGAQWSDGERLYLLICMGRRDAMRQVVESLR
jgi:outer membrane lipoprotein-sorting protein